MGTRRQINEHISYYLTDELSDCPKLIVTVKPADKSDDRGSQNELSLPIPLSQDLAVAVQTDFELVDAYVSKFVTFWTLLLELQILVMVSGDFSQETSNVALHTAVNSTKFAIGEILEKIRSCEEFNESHRRIELAKESFENLFG